MFPTTQLFLGMAAAAIVAGPSRPSALVIGAVAGVLPDLIDWWERVVFRQPAITVVPDPLARRPAQFPAAGVLQALCQVRLTARPLVLRLNPLPNRKGGYAAYWMDLVRTAITPAATAGRTPRPAVAATVAAAAGRVDRGGAGTRRPTQRVSANRAMQLVVAAAGPPVPVFPAESCRATSLLVLLHPLPLAIGAAPVDLLLAPAGRRIECRDLSRVTGTGHSLATLALLAATAFACGRWTGAAATAALVLHLLLDLGGQREWTPWALLAARTWPGRRLWNEDRWRPNLTASALAAGIVLAVLAAGIG
jgi:hypothetical protein